MKNYSLTKKEYYLLKFMKLRSSGFKIYSERGMQRKPLYFLTLDNTCTGSVDLIKGEFESFEINKTYSIGEVLNNCEIKKSVNPIFEWVKYKRKNGTEFLKLIYYSHYSDGYIEAGRFNMSKNEVVQNEWDLKEILQEISL